MLEIWGISNLATLVHVLNIEFCLNLKCCCNCSHLDIDSRVSTNNSILFAWWIAKRDLIGIERGQCWQQCKIIPSIYSILTAPESRLLSVQYLIFVLAFYNAPPKAGLSYAYMLKDMAGLVFKSLYLAACFQMCIDVFKQMLLCNIDIILQLPILKFVI